MSRRHLSPHAVQAECIPQAILGQDMLVQAKAGTGKTAVFLLGILQQLEPVAGQVGAVIVAHTRELAHQINLDARKLAKYLLPEIKTLVIFGGCHAQTTPHGSVWGSVPLPPEPQT